MAAAWSECQPPPNHTPSPTPHPHPQGPNTAGCKAATLSACALGAPTCAALAFGSEAPAKSQESLNALMEQNCNASAVIPSVAFSFAGTSKADFDSQYAKGVVSALASVTGQPEERVSVAAVREVAGRAAGAGARKLLQAASAGDVSGGGTPGGRGGQAGGVRADGERQGAAWRQHACAGDPAGVDCSNPAARGPKEFPGPTLQTRAPHALGINATSAANPFPPCHPATPPASLPALSC